MTTSAPDAPLFIVLNAGSGHEDAPSTRGTIERVLTDAGRVHRLLLVEDPRRLREIARQAVAEARQLGGVVVAAGGDGTINAVAGAALGAGCTFGVLPQGTFNYFSRANGIPSGTAEATRVLLSAEPQPVQVGLVNDRAFLVNASVGLYPEVLEEREARKRRFGRRRPVAAWSTVVTLLRAHRPLRLRLESRGAVRAVRTATLFVGNNPLQLRQLGIPEAALVPGALVAITLRPVGTLSMFWLMVRGALGRLGEAEDVSSFPFEQLTVRPAALGRRLLKVATDGEVQWLRAPLVFRLSPRPLLLLKPPPAPTGARP
jgi:diacylglycerol kinase family enzyme